MSPLNIMDVPLNIMMICLPLLAGRSRIETSPGIILYHRHLNCRFLVPRTCHRHKVVIRKGRSVWTFPLIVRLAFLEWSFDIGVAGGVGTTTPILPERPIFTPSTAFPVEPTFFRSDSCPSWSSRSFRIARYPAWTASVSSCFLAYTSSRTWAKYSGRTVE